jgi:hypothetical protein
LFKTPTPIPALFLTWIPKFVIFSASFLIKFDASTVCDVDELNPGISSARDFSEIPLNCGTPPPVILAEDKFTPGLKPLSNPSIVDLGSNASEAIIATGFPFTSIITTS